MHKFVYVAAAAASVLCGTAAAQDNQIKQMILQDPFGQFADFVRVVRSYPKNIKTPDIPPNDQIDSCVHDDLWGKTADDHFLVHLTHAATSYVGMSSGFSEAGYPRSVWYDPLNDLISARISDVIKRKQLGQDLMDINAIRAAIIPYERRLERALNEYRRSSDRSMRRFRLGWEEHCGGDWIGMTKIRTTPTGATVRLIRDFYFKLCNAKGHSPYSSNCNLWFLVGPSDEIPQGSYYYTARWPTGDFECDRVQLSHSGSGDIEAPETNIIARTGVPCRK